MPESAVATIKDLMRPDVLARMDRRIQAPHGDAVMSRASAAIVDIYGLDMVGYHFEPVTETNCLDRFEQAVAEARWVVLPLWHPHRLHHRFALRALREPLGILGGVESATLLVRRDAQSTIGRAAITDLAQLRLGNALVCELDDVLQSPNSKELA